MSVLIPTSRYIPEKIRGGTGDGGIASGRPMTESRVDYFQAPEFGGYYLEDGFVLGERFRIDLVCG